MLSVLPPGLFGFLHSPVQPQKIHRGALLWAGLMTVALFAAPAEAKALDKRTTRLETGANGTQFIWTIQDTYSGANFFE